MADQHSALPWQVGFDKGVSSFFSDRYPSAVPIVAPCPPFAFGAVVALGASADDARFIVTACNQHASLIAQRDALLAALKGLRQFALGDMDECDEACEPGCLFCAAQAAIKLTEGGQ